MRNRIVIPTALLTWATGMVLMFSAEPSRQICAGLALVMLSLILVREAR